MADSILDLDLSSPSGAGSSSLAILQRLAITKRCLTSPEPTLEYYCRVDNWPLSLVPTNGESVEMCENISQRKEKGEAFVQEELAHN